MSDILAYYSYSPSSGFWILDYDDKFVGLIALDASSASESADSDDETVTQKGSSKTALIRHFYVDEVYRASGVQADLLKHAIQAAFDSDDQVLRIRALDSPLNSYIGSCLQEAGFTIEHPIEEVGLFRWKINMRILERRVWERSRGQ
jgi:GNAT superfamily N-acetyltransferase